MKLMSALYILLKVSNGTVALIDTPRSDEEAFKLFTVELLLVSAETFQFIRLFG